MLKKLTPYFLRGVLDNFYGNYKLDLTKLKVSLNTDHNFMNMSMRNYKNGVIVDNN